ncbi:hypothetical protein [Bradyrhizobium sp. CCGUVB23]|uniref:hypothetical protein n=1 Tax=Bradyrhizobium sp. CCGUVB23 TaxID=2949630 RepID=UPI0035323B33
MIEAGATAVKGESAGVAHGLERWRNLADQARKGATTGQGLAVTPALAKACRLAFAKRPLSGERYNETVGYHLVGLLEVYVARAGDGDWGTVMIMEEIANEMAERGIEATLKARKLAVSHETKYREDDFKFDPYGIVRIEA